MRPCRRLAAVAAAAAASAASVAFAAPDSPGCAVAAAAAAEDAASNLLQVKAQAGTHRASASSSSLASASSVSAYRSGRSWSATFRCVEGSYPDVGLPLSEELKPVIDRVYKAGASHPAIGCEDGHPEDRDRPLAELFQPGGKDGFCHFGFFSQCTAAVRARDYAAYALAYSVSVTSQFNDEDSNNMHCPTGYELGDYKTAPGVFAYDGKLCHDSGFLDLPKDAYLNFSLMEQLATWGCQRLRQLPIDDLANWTFAKNGWTTTPHETDVMRAESHMRDADRKYGNPTKMDIHRHELGKCAVWDPHGLACDMAYCQYNFCRLPDGRVGQGLQCRKDWLSPEFVQAHIGALRTPPPPGETGP